MYLTPKTTRPFAHQAVLIVRSILWGIWNPLRYSSQQTRSFVQNDNTSLGLVAMLLAPSLRRPTIEQNGRQNDRSLYTSCAPWLTVQNAPSSKTAQTHSSLAMLPLCWRLAWDDKHLTFSLQIHLDALFDLSWFLTVQYAPERLTPFVPHWCNVRITKDNISKLLEQNEESVCSKAK